MVNPQTGFPGVPQAPLLGANGSPAPIWYQFFVNLWNRTGGATGTISNQLDNISEIIGSLLYRASTGWSGLPPGIANAVLKLSGGLPTWSLLTGSSFAQQAASYFLLSPVAGGTPTFRQIATVDLDSVAGEIPGTPTNDNAAAGNCGEYISSQIGLGAAVPLVSGTPSDITSIELTPGDWDVWATVASDPAAGTTTSAINAWINTVSATDPGAPNDGAYLMLQQAISAGNSLTLPIGKSRISVAKGTTTTAFLSTNMIFASSTMAAYGFLAARRVR